ncbi:GntR family transcriptional regulator [Pseudomonas aeruginosa]|uniref:GntR family transcriptional regulator n=1 Tax=Pseudomonas aeruginosa TaxID=287 RepID=UPI001053FD38|nr:GntR family transcriptional regulator [Pseudomonas aeruginosa]
MTDQLQHIRKPPRTGKAARSGTQDEIVYAHIFDAILEQRLAPGTKLSEEALGEIFGVSRTIIRRALSRLAHEQVVLLVVQEQSSFARGDRGAGIRLSGEFHLKLAEMARNAPLVSFQRSLVSQTSLIIAQYESGGRSHCSFDEHNEILDAIEKGDKERAVTLMMHHMEHIDSKLNLESDNASGDLHAVFSHLLGGKKKPRRAKADSDSAA